MSTIIGVSGISGSGKTTLCKFIKKYFEDKYKEKYVEIISIDNYYKDRSKEGANQDIPSSYDFDILHNDLLKLLNNETANIPIYDFKTGLRLKETIEIKPVKIIIVEGILVFNEKKIRDLLKYCISVETSESLALLRRQERDLIERGETFENVKFRYINHVNDSIMMHVKPDNEIYSDIKIKNGTNEKKNNDNFKFVCFGIEELIK